MSSQAELAQMMQALKPASLYFRNHTVSLVSTSGVFHLILNKSAEEISRVLNMYGEVHINICTSEEIYNTITKKLKDIDKEFEESTRVFKYSIFRIGNVTVYIRTSIDILMYDKYVDKVRVMLSNEDGCITEIGQFKLHKVPLNCGAGVISDFYVNSDFREAEIGRKMLKLAETILATQYSFSVVECTGIKSKIDSFLIANGYTNYLSFYNSNSGNVVGHYCKTLKEGVLR